MDTDATKTFQLPPITLPSSWPEEIRAQVQELLVPLLELIQKLQAENAELKRMLFGRKSERMPDLKKAVVRQQQTSGDGEQPQRRREMVQQKRKANGDSKRALPLEEVGHAVPADALVCPYCGGNAFRQLGEGEVSFEYEYVPSRFIRRKHIRQKMACRCGSYVVTAPAPRRVSEGVQYGPGFHAQVAVSKCADSIPLYRQAKQLSRVGLPINPSTLGEVFHRSAELLKPLWQRLVEQVAQERYVNADETPIQVQAKGKTRRAYMWTFIGDRVVTYVYSPSRSGATPVNVLGDTNGLLQVDAYSGYNPVTKPEGRERVGCMAHARRYFFKAKGTAPEESQWVMGQILKLYQVEYRAAELELLGTDKHLVLRQTESKPLMDEWESWLTAQKPLHTPKSPMGEAITYAQNNWEALSVFLKDPKVRLDNNISEGQLRIIALGRKNFLFLGNDVAGENLAVLQTLISTCIINEVNPIAYLTDVLIRIQDHPMSQVDELLPQHWQYLDTS